MKFVKFSLFFLALLIKGFSFAEIQEPLALYLTFGNDPTSSMVVQWITPSDKQRQRELFYRQINFSDDHDGQEIKWASQKAITQRLPQGSSYNLHRATLSGLVPGGYYEFFLGNAASSAEAVIGFHPHFFKTLPDTLTEPLRFIEGGDVYHDSMALVSQINRIGAMASPAFAVVGGDLAYASRRFWFLPENGDRWLKWISNWSKDMVSPEGLIIPMVPVIGNHDVSGGYNQTPNEAKFFYTLFSMPNHGAYYALNAGKYLSLIVLDSGHTAPISETQKKWLEETLHQNNNALFKLAAYHVPAYPSARSFNNRESVLLRRHFVPLFEKYGLMAAFEHHDHAYKRTYPIFKGSIDPNNGVIYLGDGAWGVEKPREPKSDRWYLASAKSATHILLATLHPSGEFEVTAYDLNGAVIDHSVLGKNQ